MKRIIFHIDQNCYFASVEMISHPEYRNVPMAVTGDASKRHGIILAKNELAKKAGVKTAEAIWQAEQKCPGLVKVSGHYDKYTFYSGKLRSMYEEYSDLVEPFGLKQRIHSRLIGNIHADELIIGHRCAEIHLPVGHLLALEGNAAPRAQSAVLQPHVVIVVDVVNAHHLVASCGEHGSGL